MEKDGQLHSYKKDNRPTSPSRYPKRMPTYVVAFSIHETYDDPTKPQMIGNTRSFQGSINSDNSVSSNDSFESTKTLILSPTEEPCDHLGAHSEVKIVITYDNDCGDVATSPKTENYLVVENNTADGQPQVIFNATKHRRYKKFNNRFLKRKLRRTKRVILLKNVHFKCKITKKNVSKRLYTYSKKAKKNSSLSKIVSRVLKKVSAKENLTASLNESFNFDNESLASSLSTTKKSFISHSSQNTLIQKTSSSSSRNDDWYSLETGSSVIQVPSDVAPYKTEVINVAVAVAYNPLQRNTEADKQPSNDNLVHNTSSTSNSTYVMPDVGLTSQKPSTDKIKDCSEHYNMTALNDDDLSIETLKMFSKKASVDTRSSDDDTFEIARTSSEFNKSSIQSDATLISNSETLVNSINICPEELRYEHITKYNTDRTKSNLLDTVINLGLFPEISPSTSSAINYENDLNVIVTENIMTTYALNPQNKGDDCLLDMTKGINKNVLKKACQGENNNSEPRKNINLPNETVIKAIFKENERLKKTNSSEGANNYLMNTKEMWDRLILVLDLAVKRLEDTLTEKILKDLKCSLGILFDQHARPMHEKDTEKEEIKLKNKVEKATSNKEVFVEREKLQIESNRSVQCDIVQNNVIDDLMLKLSVEEPRVVPECSDIQNVKRPKIIKKYFEILKPPAVASATDVPKPDTATVSTATPGIENAKFRTLYRFRELVAGPSAFVRENVFVITSVPAFIFVLFCVYSMIILVIKPW